MNRYKKANEGIHAPEDVKERAARPAGRPHARWAGAVAAVLAVALIGGAAVGSGLFQAPGPATPVAELDPQARGIPGSPGGDAFALAAAVYPEMAPYPREDTFDFNSDEGSDAYYAAFTAWRESVSALRSGTDYAGMLDGFLTDSTAQFLAGAGEENRIYSPLNVYMALAMLAETTGGNSRAQLLQLLEVDSIETLRARAGALWRDNYRDDGVVTSLLGNSLWLADGVAYNLDTLDTLAQRYYASAFSGEMGSEAYNQALRDWLDQQTRGLLTEQTSQLGLAPETVLALASTLYFNAAWSEEFSAKSTETDTFHTPAGDMDAEFMHKTMEGSPFYWGDDFTALELGFRQGGSMWLLLPDEGYTVDGLLESGAAMDFLLAPKCDQYDDQGNLVQAGWPGQKNLKVNLSMPKFDVSSDLDLIDGLKALGVTDVFDAGSANFDPLLAAPGGPLYVSQAQHAARVTVDEEGCEAASYTVIATAAGAPLPSAEEVDFTLDRPFLFAVTGDSGLPLFTGVVNCPSGD